MYEVPKEFAEVTETVFSALLEPHPVVWTTESTQLETAATRELRRVVIDLEEYSRSRSVVLHRVREFDQGRAAYSGYQMVSCFAEEVVEVAACFLARRNEAQTDSRGHLAPHSGCQSQLVRCLLTVHAGHAYLLGLVVPQPLVGGFVVAPHGFGVADLAPVVAAACLYREPLALVCFVHNPSLGRAFHALAHLVIPDLFRNLGEAVKAGLEGLGPFLEGRIGTLVVAPREFAKT